MMDFPLQVTGGAANLDAVTAAGDIQSHAVANSSNQDRVSSEKQAQEQRKRAFGCDEPGPVGEEAPQR